jgi:hypothetical protein
MYLSYTPMAKGKLYYLEGLFYLDYRRSRLEPSVMPRWLTESYETGVNACGIHFIISCKEQIYKWKENILSTLIIKEVDLLLCQNWLLHHLNP